MKAKGQNFTQAASVLLLSTIVVKLIGAFFKIPLSADYALGDLGFGYFSAAYDVYTPIYTLAIAGFPVAIARMVADFVAQNRFSDSKKVFYVAMRTLLIAGGVATFIVSVGSALFVEDIGWKCSLIAIAPSIFCLAVASVYRGYFEGVKNMVPTAVSNVIEALVKLILGLSIAIIVMNLTHNPALAAAGAMIGITLGTCGCVIYLAIVHKKENPVYIKNADAHGVTEREIFINLVKLCVPVAIAALSVNFTSLVDTFSLRQQLAGLLEENGENAKILLEGTLYTNLSAEEIPTVLYGIKGKAQTLFNLIPTLTTAFGVGVLPMVTDCFVRNDRVKLKENTDLMLKYSSIISLPAGLGYVFLSKNIMELLYGDMSAVLGGRVLMIYGFAAVFAGLFVPLTSYLQGVGKQSRALVNIAIGIVVKILCNVFLTGVVHINVYGAALGTALCFAVIFILHMVTLIATVKVKPDFKNAFLMPLMASVICLTVAVLMGKISDDSSLVTIIAIGTAAIIYLAFLLIFKTISIKEIKGFLNN